MDPSDEFFVREVFTQVSEIRSDGGRKASTPLRKVVVAAVVSNPYAGHYVQDLARAVEFSSGLGRMLGDLAVAALGAPVESYGKGGIAGLNGEQEHAVMFLTTSFGDALREAVGGGRAWISSATIVASPGTPLTIPLAHKDALYVRANYDAVTLYPSDAPRSDEVVVAAAVANKGRLNHRLGGLPASEIQGLDGLR